MNLRQVHYKTFIMWRHHHSNNGQVSNILLTQIMRFARYKLISICFSKIKKCKNPSRIVIWIYLLRVIESNEPKASSQVKRKILVFKNGVIFPVLCRYDIHLFPRSKINILPDQEGAIRLSDLGNMVSYQLSKNSKTPSKKVAKWTIGNA